jgi:hypothetical protein
LAFCFSGKAVMRSVISGAFVLAAGQIGHVEIKGNVPADRVSDTLLGQVLANQLSVAPKITAATDAEQVGKWSTSMFEKPSTVFLAVMDGADSKGVALDSKCTAQKECVGETCYGSTASCVMHNLMSQSSTSLPKDLTASFLEATVAHTREEPLEISEVANAVQRLQTAVPTAQLQLTAQNLQVTVDQTKASFDTSTTCARLMLAEAASMAETKSASLVVMTPRASACMREMHGAGSAEANVASALLTTAIRTAESKATGRAFTAIVSLPSTSAAAATAQQFKPVEALIESSRRLSVAPVVTGYALSSVYNVHIYGWTSLIMLLSLVAAAYSILGMTNDRDPLLYAKFRPEVDPSSRR